MNTAEEAIEAPTPLNRLSQKSRKLELHYAGIHLQEDRDSRLATQAAGVEKKFWHMVRVRVPVGALSPAQYLALDRLAERVTYNQSLRVTAGQGIQLHGLAESDLPIVAKELDAMGLAAGCDKAGFEFAIAVAPAPIHSRAYIQMRGIGAELCQQFYPRPGENDPREAPAHSPRKFTIALALPHDNSANILANDVGFLLLNEPGGGSRLNVYAGGSLSMPSRRADTYARLATPLGSIAPEHSAAVVKAIAAVFKRRGSLPTRRHTRLKYVVDALGADQFRHEVEEELGFSFSATLPHPELEMPSWSGPRDQRNGEFSYGLSVPWGRIQDAGMARYKTAIRLIVETIRPRVILTPDQNIIFAGLRIQDMDRLERILAAYHVPSGDQVTNVRFQAMACAGLPTCPLAVAESERVAPRLLGELEAELIRLGRKDFPFIFRISGCSIGCIRPNMADLGAIGRKPGHYDLYVGGCEATGRFGELYAEMVPLAQIIPTITPLLEFWANSARPGETFSDFYACWFGPDEKPVRLVPCEAIPARDRIQSYLETGRLDRAMN